MAKVLCKPVLNLPVLKRGVASNWAVQKLLELAPNSNVKTISVMGQLPDSTQHGYAFDI